MVLHPYLWFTKERLKGTPLSGPLVMEKAKILYTQLYPGKTEDDFKASTGWLQRFKQRHGIRQLRLQGETLSADSASAEEFIKLFQKYIEEHHLSMSQVFNCDETGLYWRLLPNKTLADGTEKLAKNCKTSKDRITLMATANATGDFRLPLVFIHKSAKPRCFDGVNMSALPVHYRGVGTTLEVVRFLKPRPFIFSQTYLCESYLLHVILREEFNCGIKYINKNDLIHN